MENITANHKTSGDIAAGILLFPALALGWSGAALVSGNLTIGGALVAPFTCLLGSLACYAILRKTPADLLEFMLLDFRRRVYRSV